jgi:hypothetical protein
VTQRWTGGRDSYRPLGEPIDTSKYGVEVLGSDKIAKTFVRTHHYSGSYPAARFRVGLYRTTKSGVSELVGVCVFGVPAQNASIPKWCGVAPNEGVVLSRFVLLDDVPANGESWFLGQSFSALIKEKKDLLTVLSYSDPVPRLTSRGEVVMPGHVGTIYQAFNGTYHGRSKKETQWFGPDGRLFDRRSFSKIRNGEQGAGAAYDRLLARGAPPKRSGETWAAYILRAKEESFRRVRHTGNHVYTWPLIPPFDELGKGRRKKLRREVRKGIMAEMPIPLPPLPYPKTIDQLRGS